MTEIPENQAAPALAHAPAPARAPEPLDRTAEQIRMCQEVAETALYLSRLASHKIAADLTATGALAGDSPATVKQKTADPILAYSRLTAIMHRALAHETRLTNGAKSVKTTQNRAAALNDPRRAPLRRGLNIATEFRPDRKALRREIEKNLDEKLTADPGHETAIYNLFMALCEEAGIKPDLGKIPDECLGFNIQTGADDEEPKAPAIDVHSDEFISYLRTGHPVPDFVNGGWIK